MGMQLLTVLSLLTSLQRLKLVRTAFELRLWQTIWRSYVPTTSAEELQRGQVIV